MHPTTHNSSKNQYIDYDAIMSSIKISHRPLQTFPQQPQPVEIQQTYKGSVMRMEPAHRVSFSRLEADGKQQEWSGLVMEKSSFVAGNEQGNKNYVYSSIVQDDLSRESCFQSIFRDARSDQQNIQNSPIEFKFYNPYSYPQRGHSVQNKQELTPTKFKPKNSFHDHNEAQKNKQNNGRAHNNYHQQRSNHPEPEHRYLSHTETSQKKIKTRRLTTVGQKQRTGDLKPRTNSGMKKKVHKKAGIEVINQKYYQS